MSETKKFDHAEDQILACDVSDEALETAAGSGKDNSGVYTLGSCTGYFSCPPSVS